MIVHTTGMNNLKIETTRFWLSDIANCTHSEDHFLSPHPEDAQRHRVN